ncbi:MAG: glycosyltransferase [Phascolarctobacterium sp.]|nr:glycosyltransferase [Phascolarctobacterium sp.]
MNRVSVIGLFCGKEKVYDGQTIKTRIVTQELENILGKNQVARIDTYKWKKNPFKLFFNSIKSVYNSKNVIFMTDQGGIKVFPWLLVCTNLLFNRKIHYVVIGGWLVPFLEKHSFLTACLKKIDSIFVETTKMKSGLEKLCFNNVSVMQNFKDLVPLTEKQLVYSEKEPYPFCTFSRVMKEKGIEDAVNAIKNVNAYYGRVVCKLDIYGAIETNEADWFKNLSAQFPEEIRYCGVVPYNKSIEVIKNYYALLFPTYYPSEGIPGTIIDAYSAGVPVIASRWCGFKDMIDEGETGIGYKYLNNELLTDVIKEVVKSPELLLDMKKNCLKKAVQYLPENAIGVLLEKLS